MMIYIPTWAISLAWYFGGMLVLAVALMVVAAKQARGER